MRISLFKKTMIRTLGVLCALMFMLVIQVQGGTVQAFAAGSDAQNTPSVLLIDSNLGDYDALAAAWLSEQPAKVAETKKALLVSSDAANWYKDGAAKNPPKTFLLSKKSAAVVADDVAWALDEISASGAESKTFIVAFGNTGFAARGYIQGRAAKKYSQRADVVGVAFMGTPHNGYSLASTLKSSMWDTLAKSVGLTAKDLLPSSTYLKKLNKAAFPASMKVLQVKGSVGDMGIGESDGAAALTDTDLPSSFASYNQTVNVRASVSKSLGLTHVWEDLSRKNDSIKIDFDDQLIERLSAMESYSSSPEAQLQVLDFYDAWFSAQAPSTHVSSVLTMDVSGSMTSLLSNGQSKFDAAKAAASSYMRVVEMRSSQAHAVPATVNVLGFDTAVHDICSGYGKAARKAVKGMTLGGDTDIELALNSALSTLKKSPKCADKRIVLLSDGLPTSGGTTDAILAGPVAKAKKAGVAIDTIALGEFGEADKKFLKKVSNETGGIFSESDDAQGLKATFLRSFYSSLGTLIHDEEFQGGKTIPLGSVELGTRALEIGISATHSLQGAKLLCNGSELDKKSYSLTADDNGQLAIQMADPNAGEYSLSLAKDPGVGHAFVAGNLALHKQSVVEEPNLNLSLILLVGAAAALVILIFAVVFVSRKKTDPAKRSAK